MNIWLTTITLLLSIHCVHLSSPALYLYNACYKDIISEPIKYALGPRSSDEWSELKTYCLSIKYANEQEFVSKLIPKLSDFGEFANAQNIAHLMVRRLNNFKFDTNGLNLFPHKYSLPIDTMGCSPENLSVVRGLLDELAMLHLWGNMRHKSAEASQLYVVIVEDRFLYICDLFEAVCLRAIVEQQHALLQCLSRVIVAFEAIFKTDHRLLH